MCKMSGVLWQDQQTSWEVVPHVLVPRYVRKYTVLNDLRKEKNWMRFDVGCNVRNTCWLYALKWLLYSSSMSLHHTHFSPSKPVHENFRA